MAALDFPCRFGNQLDMPKKSPAEARNRLREWRRAVRLSQEELADRLGIDPSTMSRYERGTRSLTIDMLIQIAPILKCRPADLLPDPEGVLGDRERRFLEAWNQLDSSQQDHLLATAQALAEVKRERSSTKLTRRMA